MSVRPTERVLRFGSVERAVHWTTAGLFGVLVATAAVLYVPSLAVMVGRRALVRDVHVAAGFLLPVPILVALAGRWGNSLRADLAELELWDAADRRWLRSLGRAPEARPGKFNSGQKLNTSFVVGAVLVMLATGSILHWPNPFPLAWRTGATFVHDWLALALTAILAGHVAMAITHPGSLRGMVTGHVRPAWAEQHHPRWTLSSQMAATVEVGAPKSIWPFFGLAACCAVVMAGSALAPLTAGRGRVDGPAAVARKFQAALERNDLEEAYRFLSPTARASRTEEAFFAWRISQQDDRYLDPGQVEPLVTDIAIHRQDERDGFFSVILRVTMSDGQTRWRQVDLSQAGGRWGVDHFIPLPTDPCSAPGGCHTAGG